MKIFLIGYMGSGKSLIAEQLAQLLGYSFIDLDAQISLIEEQTVSEIFKNRGELHFRKLEARVLKDVLDEPNSLVVALGGGTPCYGNNLESIKEAPGVTLVYLKASVNFLTSRLYSELSTRPVISHLTKQEDLEDFIRKHLFERGYYYSQADYTVNVEHKTPVEICLEIKERLK